MTPYKESAQNSINQQKIKNSIFRLLKIRDRSTKEISDKLKQKNYSIEEINTAIKYFKDLSLLDDNRFTEQWIRWRLSKPYGLNRIAFELKEKGIDAKTIQTALDQVKINFDEENIVSELAQNRIKKYSHLENKKIIQRIYGYLLRRGFNPETINKVIYEIKNKLKND